ncbi:2-methylcitrate dehydratase [Xylona heveae TC161]|uniref:2-methylcitrate dehydratase n=1 Tax=Xylona heveae (strain CBS 132557 / TC161) TaxID=1328760 RepID=A0A165FH43_XYLHT|nr:2-methylcitrate dehydratase [Xylona heveae TC161]KZF20974.1 2-methylcitrate dehydratase [Xylona heveae TC161]
MANKMTHLNNDNTNSTAYDDILISIVSYVYEPIEFSELAWTRAKAALLDALGVAMEGIHSSAELNQLLGPVPPHSPIVEGGFKLPGTHYQLDLLKGAFDLGTSIRYLDHNDAFPGAEWGHPSDNIGAILPVTDILCRRPHTTTSSHPSPTMKDVLTALIKAYEIQGTLQIENAFNKIGLDHVILVKVASTAVVCWLLGLSRDQALAAVSHAWVDGHPLRVYRQAPNTGPRKGWAAGDAVQRAVHLALLAAVGQPGVKSALTAPKWGFYDVLFHSKQLSTPKPFGSWVVENVLFKVNTAEGHGLTAIEAALKLSKNMQRQGIVPELVERVRVRTHEAAMIIINKSGPLHNAADRDHDLRYMVAVVLLKGAQIDTKDYQDESAWATDPRVEELRRKITVVEEPQFTQDYHNIHIRSLTNAIQITLSDGTWLDEEVVEFPDGHVKSPNTLALVREKAVQNLGLKFNNDRVKEIIELVDSSTFDEVLVSDFIDLFTP